MLQIKKEFEISPENLIKEHLDSLEQLIDTEHIQRVEEKQLDVFNFHEVDKLPIIISTRNDVAHKTKGKISWPEFPFHQMWHDYGAMLLNELRPVYESAVLKDDKVFSVRPNMSQIFMPAMLGAQGIYYSHGINSMPAVDTLSSEQMMDEAIESEIDYKHHWTIKKYCEIIDHWRYLLSDFPNMRKTIRFSLPDLQGPFNLYFLLRGSDAYYDVIIAGEFLHKMMRGLTGLIINVTNYLMEYIGYNGIGYYWNYSFPGKIRNVDDNAVQISHEHYFEFVLPYNRLLAEKCGGGIHHYCGKGDHIIDAVMSITGTVGLNFGNPEMQDWNSIYEKALNHKVVLLYDKAIPFEIFKELKYGVIMKIIVSSLEEGKKILSKYA